MVVVAVEWLRPSADAMATRQAGRSGRQKRSVMIERSFTVVLEPEEEGGFSVSVPALPEIATQGDTLEEALANAREAIAIVLADRRERDEEIPPSDTGARIERVQVAV